MHVVQQFHLFAQFLAAGFEEFQRPPDVDRRLEHRFIVQRLDGGVAAAR